VSWAVTPQPTPSPVPVSGGAVGPGPAQGAAWGVTPGSKPGGPWASPAVVGASGQAPGGAQNVVPGPGLDPGAGGSVFAAVVPRQVPLRAAELMTTDRAAGLVPQVFDPQQAGQVRDLQAPLQDAQVPQTHGLRTPAEVAGSVPPHFHHLLSTTP
jgi:hypothetical protein